MADAKENFPGFAEVCDQARRMEKKLLSIQLSQISGKMVYDDNLVIFPKEFDEYTYPYALSMARNVEQKLFAVHFATQGVPAVPAQGPAPAPVAKTKAAEQALEQELHAFAEAQQVPVAPTPPTEEELRPAKPSGFSMQGLKFPSFFPQKKAAAPMAAPQAPQSKTAPAVPPAPPAVPATAPPIKVPSIPSVVAPPPTPPKKTDEAEAEIEKEQSLEMGGEAPAEEEPSEGKEEEPGEPEEGQPEAQAVQAPEAAKAPQPGKPAREELKNFIASSKISPRLRKIIEEKLKKEEAEEKRSRNQSKSKGRRSPKRKPQKPSLSRRRKKLSLRKMKAKGLVNSTKCGCGEE